MTPKEKEAKRRSIRVAQVERYRVARLSGALALKEGKPQKPEEDWDPLKPIKNRDQAHVAKAKLKRLKRLMRHATSDVDTMELIEATISRALEAWDRRPM